ncbi:MAG: hypothetical protein EXS40_08755 [Opitutaceae bacterium]|nr:hypothetical protein [Opitutaceae bacterium]
MREGDGNGREEERGEEERGAEAWGEHGRGEQERARWRLKPGRRRGTGKGGRGGMKTSRAGPGCARAASNCGEVAGDHGNTASKSGLGWARPPRSAIVGGRSSPTEIGASSHVATPPPSA